MKKIFILALLASLGGCSNIQINGVICDNVGVGSDPAMQNGVPQECRNYDEKEAEKAFNKEKEQKKADVEDIIEFQKEQKEQ
jgi:hypothetical protein